MNVEDVLSSRLRMRILKILGQIGELNVSDIARRLGVNFTTTSGHLRVLENEGLLLHKSYGRIRLYRLNDKSAKAVAVGNLMDVWERVDKQHQLKH